MANIQRVLVRAYGLTEEGLSKRIKSWGIIGFGILDGEDYAEATFSTEIVNIKSIIENLKVDNIDFTLTKSGDFINPPHVTKCKNGEIVEGFCFNYTGEEDGLLTVSEVEDIIFEEVDPCIALGKIKNLVSKRNLFQE